MWYLSYNSFSRTVVFIEKVICLDEELAGVFLSLSLSPLPQDHRRVHPLLLVHCMLSVLFLQEMKSKKELARKPLFLPIQKSITICSNLQLH